MLSISLTWMPQVPESAPPISERVHAREMLSTEILSLIVAAFPQDDVRRAGGQASRYYGAAAMTSKRDVP